MKNKSVADLAYEILNKYNKPLHYRKITEELIKIKPLKIKEPYYTVNASMSGDKRFMRTKRGIWGLVKWKYKDANIKYSLTSYCLKDGTIFLSSYIKPYFPKDEKGAEIVFIDREGEEIEAFVNYEVNRIFGLKKWYEKKKLKINDIIYIGLIDYDRKRYFLVTENETIGESSENLEEKIIKVLEEEGQPLAYKELCNRVLEFSGNNHNLFQHSLLDILKKNKRFICEKEDYWGLFDWLNEFKKLEYELWNPENNDQFKEAILKAFKFLGYESSLVSKGKSSFILAKAMLDYKTYHLILDGIINHNSDTQEFPEYLSGEGLKMVKENFEADFFVLIAPAFDYSRMAEYVQKNNLILFELKWLHSILQEHQHLPFSLISLKNIFLEPNNIESAIENLIKQREMTYRKISLINLVIKVLDENKNRKLYLNPESLTRIVNQKKINGINFEDTLVPEVEGLCRLLSQEPFNLIQLTEVGSIILNFPLELAKKRLEQIINTIFYFT